MNIASYTEGGKKEEDGTHVILSKPILGLISA
jgi:hypothetical protein